MIITNGNGGIIYDGPIDDCEGNQSAYTAGLMKKKRVKTGMSDEEVKLKEIGFILMYGGPPPDYGSHRNAGWEELAELARLQLQKNERKLNRPMPLTGIEEDIRWARELESRTDANYF